MKKIRSFFHEWDYENHMKNANKLADNLFLLYGKRKCLVCGCSPEFQVKYIDHLLKRKNTMKNLNIIIILIALIVLILSIRANNSNIPIKTNNLDIGSNMPSIYGKN